MNSILIAYLVDSIAKEVKAPLSLMVLACFGSVFALHAQAFLNGTLNGTIAISATPTSWSQVPFGDPVSFATMAPSATSDVTGTTGPVNGNINGNPYHGTTLVSGLHMSSGPDTWHEGIMQTLSGLSIGQSYSIRFYQNVIKQSNGIDPSGSWAVYKENTLIAISAPCTDNSPVGSNSHPWFLRTVTFTATSAVHNIKFLPRDDDANIVSPNGVRMGIDSITIVLIPPFAAPLNYALSLKAGDQVALDWEAANTQGLSHFVVEHSSDGVHFEEIGRVNAAGQMQFQYIDESPFIETYYRIGSLEFNGAISYTEVQRIMTQAPVEVSQFGRRLKLHGGYGGVYSMKILDMQGQLVFEQRGPDEADVSLLSSGIYFLRVISEGRQNAILDKKIFLQ